MKIINLDYKNLKVDQKCIKILPLDFIEKYNCIIYCKYEDGYVVLVNRNFEYFNVSKLSFFIKDEIYLCWLKENEWNDIITHIKINDNRDQAINKFHVNSDIITQNILNEKNNIFYNAEIENSPIVKIIDSIIEEAISYRSSDIHFEPYESFLKVKFRVDGKLFEMNPLPIEALSEVSTRIKVLSNLDITKKYTPQDGKLIYNYNEIEYDIRVSILPSTFGERIALRILDTNKSILTIDDLGFSTKSRQEIEHILNFSSGLVLVVGPTGSGKSTTLHAFLKKNLERNENIITVEDPVEYKIEGISQVQINEEAGLDFAVCLKTILRQDPNIIMIGEIRDLETAKIACRASITGHLVYSTLHTNTSIGVINRLRDMNIEPFLLADSLRGIISQRLVRCLCPNCKEKTSITKNEIKFLEAEENVIIYKPKGCVKCNMTGYIGRQGVYEVIIIDDDFKKLIIDNASSSKYWNLVKKKSFERLVDNAKKLVLDGITSIEEIQSILN